MGRRGWLLISFSLFATSLAIPWVFYYGGPRLFPEFTVRYSPWVYPVVEARALTNHQVPGAEARFSEWGEAAFPSLIRITRDQNPEMRWYAASILSGHFTGNEPGVFEALMNAAENDADRRVRIASSWGLVVGGDPEEAERRLREIALNDQDKLVVLSAIHVLQKRGWDNRKINEIKEARRDIFSSFELTP